MPFTLVSFHAHPDDEALLTAGTLARAVAEGHRVVVVVATRGEAGLASAELSADLAARRMAEVDRSCRALGVHRVVELGYGDSGMDGRAVGERPAFVSVPVAEAAGRLVDLLREESADVLTVYDVNGGYGHPDHRRVHEVGVAAAGLAGTPVVLEATVDRRLLERALRLIRRLPGLPDGFAADLSTQYADPASITHRVDVRRYLPQKRAAMSAHVSQASADGADRTLAFALRLPRVLYRIAFGREWFVERGRIGADQRLDDIFASLR